MKKKKTLFEATIEGLSWMEKNRLFEVLSMTDWAQQFDGELPSQTLARVASRISREESPERGEHLFEGLLLACPWENNQVWRGGESYGKGGPMTALFKEGKEGWIRKLWALLPEEERGRALGGGVRESTLEAALTSNILSSAEKLNMTLLFIEMGSEAQTPWGRGEWTVYCGEEGARETGFAAQSGAGDALAAMLAERAKLAPSILRDTRGGEELGKALAYATRAGWRWESVENDLAEAERWALAYGKNDDWAVSIARIALLIEEVGNAEPAEIMRKKCARNEKLAAGKALLEAANLSKGVREGSKPPRSKI